MIIVVSGLPRSGTSMMMRMLDAGGVPVVTDHVRKPDEDNPRGYYELEVAKKIKEDTSWLDECHGKVFKMVSQLLYDLPSDNEYKVIFMRRAMPEILVSQKVMLERLGQESDSVADEQMGKLFEKHLEKIMRWLAARHNLETLYVNFNETVEDPRATAQSVSAFLGGWPDVDAMAAVVERKLYRQREDTL